MHAEAAGRSLFGGEDAELVALGIGQHHPGLVALTDFDVTRPEGDDAVDLGPLVIGPEVEVDAVLDDLVVGHRDEEPVGSGSGRARR